MDDEPKSRIHIPAREGRAARLRAGDRLTVIDVQGSQVGDLFAFSADDPAEYLSASHTRVVDERLFPAVGGSFMTNRRRAILEFTQDDSPGVHDMLMAACDPARYALLGHPVHASCADNLASALKEFDVSTETVPQPVNLFMNIPVSTDGTLNFEPSPTEPGDFVTLTAVTECIVVVSACPQDLNSVNGGTPTELLLEIR